jgi:hypothetical protein
MAETVDTAMNQVPTNQTPIKGEPTKEGFRVELCALNVVMEQYKKLIRDTIKDISK